MPNMRVSMNALERKTELLKRRVRVMDLARELGVSAPHASLVLSEKTTCERPEGHHRQAGAPGGRSVPALP